MKEEKIDDLVHVQTIVSRYLRIKFKAKCKADDTTPSQWMRNKIKEYVGDDK